jgi:hypothetical protein
MFQPRIDDKEQTIADREEDIKKLNTERHLVEDRVFQDFCRKIGVKHIR